jgi:hypothetical protein
MCSGTTPPKTVSVASDDELLLERLSALVQEIDPVPANVTAVARAAFRPSAEASQPRRRGGVAGEPGLLGLAELLGPPV